jgi:molybdenum cofactor cytidylyltransferase
VIVVLGHDAAAIRPAVPDTARIVLNEGYREGRATSLRRGAEAVLEDAEAVVILSVDQPRPAWVSRLLIERRRSGPAPIVSPRFPRRFGHPVLVDASLLAELRRVDDATLGLRAVVERHKAEAVSVPIENEQVDVDLNTPADYEAALAAFASGAWAEPQADR